MVFHILARENATLMRNPDDLALVLAMLLLATMMGASACGGDRAGPGGLIRAHARRRTPIAQSTPRHSREDPMRLLLRALPLLLLSLAVHAAEVDRRIAVTIDDLPWARLDQIVPPDLQARHEALMAQLRQAGVPVVGFVNENKLEVDGQVQPARVQMLRDWRDAGYVLGNHTYSHMDLNAKGVAAFQQDFLRGETVLRPLLAEKGQVPQWMRHPTCALAVLRMSACRWMGSSSSMATAWRR